MTNGDGGSLYFESGADGGIAPTPFGPDVYQNFVKVTRKPVVYLIGSMRNPKIPGIAIDLRNYGYEVFDDWYAPGKDADDCWQFYARERGQTYKEALADYHAKNVFEFDKRHLDRADAAVLAMPAGRSGHMELGYMVGKGKPAFVLFEEEPDRFDVMYQFATDVVFNLEDLRIVLGNTLGVIQR